MLHQPSALVNLRHIKVTLLCPRITSNSTTPSKGFFAQPLAAQQLLEALWALTSKGAAQMATQEQKIY